MTIFTGYYVYGCPNCSGRVWVADCASFYSGCMSPEDLERLHLPNAGPEPDTKCERCGHWFAATTAKLLKEVTWEALKAWNRDLLDPKR